jgi:hypothetical protein
MRRYNNNCNTASAQDRIPISFFFGVGIILIHHCVLLLIQFKTIPLPEVNAFNVNQIITQRIHRAAPFATTTRSVTSLAPKRKSQLKAYKQEYPETRRNDNLFHSISSNVKTTTASIALGSMIFCSTMSVVGAIQPAIVNAYEDYISEPVQIAIKAVQDANTNDALVKAYENIAEIITEGKGVGGSINFQGVQLD